MFLLRGQMPVTGEAICSTAGAIAPPPRKHVRQGYVSLQNVTNNKNTTEIMPYVCWRDLCLPKNQSADAFISIVFSKQAVGGSISTRVTHPPSPISDFFICDLMSGHFHDLPL